MPPADIGSYLIHDIRLSSITNWARELPIHVVQQLAVHSDVPPRRSIISAHITDGGNTDPHLTHLADLRRLRPKQPENEKSQDATQTTLTEIP